MDEIVTYIGSDHYVKIGIVNVLRDFEMYINCRYSSVVIFDSSSCLDFMGDVSTDENKLLVVLVERDIDCYLFSRSSLDYDVIYIPYKETYGKIYKAIQNQFSPVLIFNPFKKSRRYSISFTNREAIILRLLLRTYSVWEISYVLNIPVKRVYYTKSAIMRK